MNSRLEAELLKSKGLDGSKRMLVLFTLVGVFACLPIMPWKYITSLPSEISKLTAGQNSPLPEAKSKTKDSVQSQAKINPTPQLHQVQMLASAANDISLQIEHNPQDPALYNRLGLIYQELGELDKAKEKFQTSVTMARSGLSGLQKKSSFPQDTKAGSQNLIECSRLNTELSAAHSNLARLYEMLGQHDLVMSELNALNNEGMISSTITKRPEEHRLTPTTAKLVANGESLMQTQQFPQAIAQFRKALAIDPNLALAHHQIGLASAMSSNTSMAIAELSTASQLEPNNAVTHNNLALAYQKAGLPAKAEQEFAAAIRLDPRLNDAVINLGNLLAGQGRYSDALGIFKAAAVNNPQSAVAHNNYGAMLALAGKNEEAIGEYHKSIALNPNLGTAHYGLGLALFNTQNYSQSVSEFRQSLVLNPSLNGAHNKIEQALRKVHTTL